MLLEENAEGAEKAGKSDTPVGRNIRTEGGGGRCKVSSLLRVFVVLGVIFTGLGLVFVLFYRDLFISLVSDKLPLHSESSSLPFFENPPADAKASFFFFNLTNPDDVTFFGEKPVVKQIGPYVWKIVETREQVDFSDNDTLVHFQKLRHFQFDRNASVGDEDDEVVTLDLVAYGGLKATVAKNFAKLGITLLDSNKRNQPFRTFRIGDLLWGQHDELYNIFLSMNPNTPEGKKPIFGLMHGKNATTSMNFSVHTGLDDIQKIQSVKLYNGTSRLPNIWPVVNVDGLVDPNIIKGTLGNAFQPDLDEDDVLTVFSPDICFNLNFTFNYETETGGVNTLRYGIDYEDHRRLTGAINREFCDADDVNFKHCALPGVINATKCRDGSPIILSWPHFLETDYLYLVDGLQPSPFAHGPFIEVDPLTGMTLNGAKRIQINFPMTPLPHENFKNLPKFTLYPIMWVEESGGISKEGMEVLNGLIYNKYRLLQGISYGVFGLGLLMLTLSILVYFVYVISCADRLQSGAC